MPQTCWRGGPIIFAFVCSGCPLEGYPAMQLRALLAHRLLQRLQRYHRHTQRSARCHNHTNAGMQPVTNGRQNRSISLARRGRELARLFVERLPRRLCIPRQVLFVARDKVGIGIASRVAVRCIAAGIGSSCSGCSLRKLKFIIGILALQSTCLQIGKAAICSSIAICTTCLLPWYLPQSRSRWDWRRRGPLLGNDR